jgi:hypothetical protein
MALKLHDRLKALRQGSTHQRLLPDNFAIHEAIITLADNWLAQVINDFTDRQTGAPAAATRARQWTRACPSTWRCCCAEGARCQRERQGRHAHHLAQRVALKLELARSCNRGSQLERLTG